MKVPAAISLIALTAGLASGQATIEFLPIGYGLSSLSVGGRSGAGNVTGDISYETFRWTTGGAIERLGRATFPVIGVAAGTPDISYDGKSISASILSTDNQMTPGIWYEGSGWTEIMPPMPSGGASLDNSYGSAWGLSGDGETITGFHWGTVGTSIRARACTWSSTAGMIDLPQNDNRDARVNAASMDGSVVVGWASGDGGAWRPTAWRGGARFQLQDTAATCQAAAVNTDGSVIVGSTYDALNSMRTSARWTWNGASYDTAIIGVLPGTLPNFGEAMLIGVSGDGGLAVGWNRYSQGPLSAWDGIVWTPAGGLVSAPSFIASLGLASSFTPDMRIRQLVAVSPDGSAIAGYVVLQSTGEQQSFVIHITPPPCAGDADRDGDIDFADITAVLANFNTAGAPFKLGDADGSAAVNFGDITAVLANFSAPCH